MAFSVGEGHLIWGPREAEIRKTPGAAAAGRCDMCFVFSAPAGTWAGSVTIVGQLTNAWQLNVKFERVRVRRSPLVAVVSTGYRWIPYFVRE